jgi:serine/threonine protein kinase
MHRRVKSSEDRGGARMKKRKTSKRSKHTLDLAAAASSATPASLEELEKTAAELKHAIDNQRALMAKAFAQFKEHKKREKKQSKDTHNAHRETKKRMAAFLDELKEQRKQCLRAIENANGNVGESASSLTRKGSSSVILMPKKSTSTRSRSQSQSRSRSRSRSRGRDTFDAVDAELDQFVLVQADDHVHSSKRDMLLRRTSLHSLSNLAKHGRSATSQAANQLVRSKSRGSMIVWGPEPTQQQPPSPTSPTVAAKKPALLRRRKSFDRLTNFGVFKKSRRATSSSSDNDSDDGVAVDTTMDDGSSSSSDEERPRMQVSDPVMPMRVLATRERSGSLVGEHSPRLERLLAPDRRPSIDDLRQRHILFDVNAESKHRRTVAEKLVSFFEMIYADPYTKPLPIFLDKEDNHRHLLSILDKQYLLSFDELSVDYDRVLGEGAYGRVYLGEYRGERVAIKVLHETERWRAAILRAFEREVVSMRRTAGIVEVIEFVGACLEPRPCIVTKFMAGGSLHQALYVRGARYSLTHAVELATTIARGLTSLHSMRPSLLHRDLTTMNVLMNGADEPRIGDFGISRFKASKHQPTSPIGAPRYKAPELHRLGSATTACDVWMFGTVLFELMFRRKPFSATLSDRKISRRLAAGHMPTVPTYETYCDGVSPIPEQLLSLITECWSNAPGLRPTAPELVERLTRIGARLGADRRQTFTAPSSASSSMTSASIVELLSSAACGAASQDSDETDDTSGTSDDSDSDFGTALGEYIGE